MRKECYYLIELPRWFNKILALRHNSAWTRFMPSFLQPPGTTVSAFCYWARTLDSACRTLRYGSFVVVQALSCVQLFVTPWTEAQACPSFTISQSLLKLMVHWVGDAIQSSHPLLPPYPPALNLSQHQGLFSKSTLPIRWPKYWSFSFSISPSNKYSGLISFRIYWFDLLAAQGTLKSLLQQHNSKASIL